MSRFIGIILMGITVAFMMSKEVRDMFYKNILNDNYDDLNNK